MASNFSSLRSSRKAILAKLAEEAKKETQKGSGNVDERFWKLTVDPKTKIGYARIRFLPAPKGEELPWVRVFSHGFKGPAGSYYIENCPTSLDGRACPVCKENNRLWNSGNDADKDVARARKRRQNYISNILVLDDPAKPENNGKVFLFKYGPKIHDKIKELIQPEFPDQEPTNPFDMWEGADFKLKSRDYQGYQNYDKSEFDEPSELFEGDDAAKEKLWESQYSLMQFLSDKEFKSYEELERKLNAVLTGKPDRPKTIEDAIKRTSLADDDEVIETAKKTFEKIAASDDDEPPVKKPTKKSAAPKKVAEPEPEEDATAFDDDDAIRSFFAGLGDE